MVTGVQTCALPISVQLGEVMRGSGAGQVVASTHPDFAVGDEVMVTFGWQEFAVLSPDTQVRGLSYIEKDRKSVVEGMSVDLGCRRIIKKKKC